MTTLTQARDEVQAQFRTVWLADPISAQLPVLYMDVADVPPEEGAWARINVQHGSGGQRTLSGDTGQRRYGRTGVVTVQIFTPRGDGMELNDQLSAIATRAFEGITTSPGRVSFLRVRPNEIGPDGRLFHTNVLADIEYDEVR